MASNEEQIRTLYAGGKEEGRAVSSRANSMEFTYTKRYLDRIITAQSRVIEIGCGTGYYGLHYGGRCRSYLGVDLSPENIQRFRGKIADAGLTNVTAEVGDATHLSGIPDGSYDVVLCLGPMYHLPADERMKVFAECVRIAEKGAHLAFAYINRIGVYAGGCVFDNLRQYYPNETANHFVFDLSTDDSKPGVFFYTSPEEMEADGEKSGLTVTGNHGVDFFFAASAIESMTEEQFAAYRRLADAMSESGSCTGLANHALMLCTK